MKKIYLIISVLLFCSCTKYYKYAVSGSKEQSLALEKAKILNDNQIFLCFTTCFENTIVRVTQDNNTLFEGRISTGLDGKAEALKVTRGSDVKIHIDGIKNKLLIKASDLGLYKFVYIYKKNDKGFLYFNDSTMHFDENNVFFPIYSIKDYNCRITQIDSSANSYLIKFHKTGLFKKKREELLVVGKVDTIINDLPRLNIGKIYKFTLSDKFYNETINKLKKTNEEKFYYDEDDKLIWEKKTDRKFYTTDNIINLNYVEQ